MARSEAEERKLKKELVEAFSDIPYPGDDRLSDDANGAERDGVAKIFAGKRWQEWVDRPLQMLQEGDYCQNIFSLSAPAYRHFLPLFLLVYLFDYMDSDKIPGEILQTLTRPEEPKDFRTRTRPEDTRDFRDYKVDLRDYKEKVESLSLRQLNVVADVMRYLLKTDLSKMENKDIAKALASIEAVIAAKKR